SGGKSRRTQYRSDKATARTPARETASFKLRRKNWSYTESLLYREPGHEGKSVTPNHVGTAALARGPQTARFSRAGVVSCPASEARPRISEKQIEASLVAGADPR